MASVDPKIIIRLGSHSEKEYVLKTAKHLDGIIVPSNLFEATPGATASLLGKTLKCPYYIDPMTYVYGCNLDWIKSEQKIRGSKKKTKGFKRSYMNLAQVLGGRIKESLAQNRPVSPDDFKEAITLDVLCENVVGYQENRVREEFEKDEGYKQYAEDAAKPRGVFSPYFHIPQRNSQAWLDLNMRLLSVTVKLKPTSPVYGVICTEAEMLDDSSFMESMTKSLLGTGSQGVWLRFWGFNEWEESANRLYVLRTLIEKLNKKLEVYNMSGGYFSLILAKYGLRGVSHGVGYGEQRKLEPIIAQAMPTVNYYLPETRRRFGIPDIERCFDDLNIETPDDFHEKVCGCVVCKGIVLKHLKDFQAFGERRYARADSQRESQTPAAAKRCRFHFLLNRIAERDQIMKASLAEIREQLQQSANTWGKQASIMRYCTHLQCWSDILA
ncbi:MAG: hypothetical protein ABSB25_08650 [Sedimentisphaerales bacterium]|jgi:hypothetical protein